MAFVVMLTLELLATSQVALSLIDHNSLKDARALMEFRSTVWNDPFNFFQTWHLTNGTGIKGIDHSCNFKGIICDGYFRPRFVDISGNQLRGIVAPVLGNLSLCHGFNLSNNEFMGSIPKGFGNMPNLKHLDLSNNLLTGTPGCPIFLIRDGLLPAGVMPADVGKLRHVRFYSLANNLLGGKLAWLNISWLEHLDLSGNNIGGSIPDTYGIYLKNLTFLNLESNKLTGAIPETLGYLRSLRRLDLSNNKLTGQIPYSLTMATHIKRLRLINNSLSGNVPDTETMRLFASNAFFPGNDGLCGAVVGRPCPAPPKIWRKIVIAVFVPTLIISVLTWILRFMKPPDEFSLRTIRKITDNFNNNKILSVGSLWTIYKGVLFTGKAVNVKRLRPEYYNYDKDVFEEERKLLKAMSHPNIVKYLGACSTSHLKVFVYEHMHNGCLDMHLHNERAGISSLSWSTRMDIAAGVAQGLAYLHGEWKEPQMHCDLNGSTVLLDDKFNARITDIRSQGASKLFTSLETNIGLSTGYHPPEYLVKNEHTPEGEVFSFGTLLMELLTGTEAAALVRNGVEGGLQGIMKRAFPSHLQYVLDPDILKGSSHDQIVLCTKIALECTKANPEERPKMQCVLKMFEQAYSINPMPLASSTTSTLLKSTETSMLLGWPTIWRAPGTLLKFKPAVPLLGL